MKKYSAIVVSAPSGAGKSTLNSKLIRELDNVDLCISHTTRGPRAGEQAGVHYYYIDPPEFQLMVEREEFVEWANVHTASYGTSRLELERIRSKGHIPLLEIDVQGWLMARDKIGYALSIFILPPSLQVLWQRLEGRQSETFAQRWVRLQNAVKEIEKAGDYEHIIINENLDEAYAELRNCVLSTDTVYGKDTHLKRKLCENLLDEFKHASWVRQIKERL
jgi:guanylate kinase